MKAKGIWITLMALIALAFSAEEKGTLKIMLSNIKKTGKIRAGLYREGDNFPSDKSRVRVLTADPSDGKCGLLFDEIPYGAYAIAVYQDVNGNGKLDKGMFGIPEEPFAFSNNFRPKFGGPSFDRCRFEFKENNQTLTIEMINSMFGGE